MSGRERGFTTRALGAGAAPPAQRPVAPPIHPSSTFAFDDMDAFADVAQRKIEGGYLYSRWANPTVEQFGTTVAALEGAEATACFASGMGAIHATLSALLGVGDHVVAARQLYGGTRGLLAGALPRAGIEVSLVDITDHAAVEAACTRGTRVLYAETIGNPALPVADIEALASIAHAHDALLVLDATMTPPYLLRPLSYGADIVLHSATKYISGHADVTAGVVSGPAERIASIRRSAIDTGATLSPFDAWLCARGVQTLALRMDRICDTALTVARALEEHPAVVAVSYPGLGSHPQHGLAQKLLGERFGGMVTFEVADRAVGRRMMERVRIAAPAASLGGTKTLIVHPASVTHTQLGPDELAAAGLRDGTMRLSIGIEDAPDILDDLTGALG